MDNYQSHRSHEIAKNMPSWFSGLAIVYAGVSCGHWTPRRIGLFWVFSIWAPEKNSNWGVANLLRLVTKISSKWGHFYFSVQRLNTEIKMLSFWRNFHHQVHWQLSCWQLPVQPETKIPSKLWYWISRCLGCFVDGRKCQENHVFFPCFPILSSANCIMVIRCVMWKLGRYGGVFVYIKRDRSGRHA